MKLNGSRSRVDVNTKFAIDARTKCSSVSAIGVEEKTRSDQRGEEYRSLLASA
jgi:hypothetical protein